MSYHLYSFEEDHAAGRSTGAFGMLDQQSGLWWVQHAARSFGGDPARTIIHIEGCGLSAVRVL